MSNHETYWTTLMAAQAARLRQRRRSRWTPADVLACLQSWADYEQRLPLSSEFGPHWQLPNYSTIVLLFGSIAAAYAVLGWTYTPYGGRGAPGRSLALGQEPSDEDGSWMNGSPVREDGDALDWWEDH